MWPPYSRPTGKQQQFSHKYHAAHYWPHPYNCQDRQYIREVLRLQSANGWIAETTLYGYHFDSESNVLTDSGKMHLQWILENVPAGHRIAWVETATKGDVSQQRLGTVREAAIAMVGEEHAPPVMLRVTSPLGRPALEVDVIRRAEIESIPEPRISYEPLPTGSGGGS